jgi:hypothetical protein
MRGYLRVFAMDGKSAVRIVTEPIFAELLAVGVEVGSCSLDSSTPG